MMGNLLIEYFLMVHGFCFLWLYTAIISLIKPNNKHDDSAVKRLMRMGELRVRSEPIFYAWP
ncbi:MAG: hypothetical protein D3908_02950 [Candidatus Electrothrix sp. AUS4]|nr:hypothetical protein [Candidatus Electrothrix sp. AUS4]